MRKPPARRPEDPRRIGGSSSHRILAATTARARTLGASSTVCTHDGNGTTYTYDAANRLTGTTLGNGLISDRTYDDADRLTNLANRNGGTPISSYAYSLDDVGNRTQVVDTTGTTTYTYDDLYRLTDVTYPNTDVQTYDYDPMGNRTEKTHNSVPTAYSYDDADQMTLAGGVAYDYDDNGNQIEAGTDTFEWERRTG